MEVRLNITRYDDHVVDEPVRYTDLRTRPDCQEYWEGHYVEINGERYIKQETADRIILENHDLRETLYMQEAEETQHAFDLFARGVGQGTYDTKRVVSYTAGVLKTTEREVYKLLYKHMEIMLDIDFDECPSGKSKLNWIWEHGWLPHVNVYLHAICDLARFFRHRAPTEWDDLLVKLMGPHPATTKRAARSPLSVATCTKP